MQAARLEAEEAEDVEEQEEGPGEGDEDAQAAELYCLCRQPDDPAAPRDFVACDKCEQWFHPECVDTTMEVRALYISLVFYILSHHAIIVLGAGSSGTHTSCLPSVSFPETWRPTICRVSNPATTAPHLTSNTSI